MRVEAHARSGLPGVTIVGLPGAAVREARERVRSGAASSGLALPTRRITINLSPGDVPKDGSGFDLPVALATLAACGQLPAESLREVGAVGEVSLDGMVRPSRGMLPVTETAGRIGVGLLIVPLEGLAAACEVSLVPVAGVRSLAEAVRVVRSVDYRSHIIERGRRWLRTQRQPVPVDSVGEVRSDRGSRSPPCKEGVGDRRGRGSSPAHGRFARCGKDHAGPQARGCPASLVPRGSRRGDSRVERRRFCGRALGSDQGAALSGAAPHCLQSRPGGRRRGSQTGRGQSGPPRSSLSGRVAGILPRRHRGTETAPRGRQDRDQQKDRHVRIPGGFQSGGGHEPLSVRIPGAHGEDLPLSGFCRRALPRAYQRTFARPDRRSHRDPPDSLPSRSRARSTGRHRPR